MTHRCIGILAGMGPRSTAPFIDMVVSECQKQYGARDDIDFPKMMICSQPAPFYEDRPPDHGALQAAIKEGLHDLERAGADFLAIACNTAHIYYSALADCVSIPLINMVDLAVDAIPNYARKVAIIAAQPTVQAEIYQIALHRRSIMPFTVSYQDKVNHLLAATRTSADASLFSRLWRDIMNDAEQGGADIVLVACLDLSGVISHARTQLPIIDAAQCLAHEIVRQWLLRNTSSK